MIDKIHHVGVVLPDADAALGFFRDLMGLEVTEDRTIEEQGVPWGAPWALARMRSSYCSRRVMTRALRDTSNPRGRRSITSASGPTTSEAN